MQYFLGTTLMVLLLAACNSEPSVQHQMENYQIIPLPQNIAPGIGYFELDATTKIDFDAATPELGLSADYLTAWMESKGLVLDAQNQGKQSINLRIKEDLNAAAYILTITEKGVLLQGGSPEGVFYGMQSLLQLIQQQFSAAFPIDLPCVHIEDEPAFAYRGMHLDVGRHFFPVDFIKKYIDLLARYKMNRFHWHLTEDQGWRIEIKQYPKLQEVAAFRKETLIGHYNDTPQKYDGTPYGGYYTQEEVKDVVKYAQERFITIIPEIEMPGHAQAALAAYPELSCAGGPIETATKWGVFDEVYCPTEATFTFLENVLTEVMDLFPSEYIHIGGDECPKTKWKESAFCQQLIKEKNLKDEHGLQSYFISRMEAFLNKNGRQIIGWDEILEGGLAPNATVMSWRGEQGGIDAAKQGHDVIMTPTSHCYLDYYQFQHPDEPLAIGGYLPIEKVYSYHPIPEELSNEEASYIKGVQGNLWTEYVATPEKVEYMAFPRGLAIAEIGWTQKSNKDFGHFIKRLEQHLKWLKRENVNAANPLYHIDAEVLKNDAGELSVRFSNLSKSPNIRYTKDGSPPTAESTSYSAPIKLSDSGVYTGQVFADGQALGRSASVTYNQHLASNAVLTLENQPSPKYNAGGPQAVINGIKGSDEKYGDKEWLGFEGDDFIANIDLKESKDLQEVQLRFFNGPGQWIYPPKMVEIYAGESPDKLELVAKQQVKAGNGKIVSSKISLQNQSTRYLKILVHNYGVIPEGRQGGGNRAWLFIDEIVLF